MKSNPLVMAIRRTLGATLALAGAGALSVPVYAQEPDVSTLDEIIVTARKVAENLQETPIAITAITGAALDDRQVFRTEMLDQVVPNLQYANNAPLAGNN